MKKKAALLLVVGILFLAQISCNFPTGNQIDAEQAIAATLTFTGLGNPAPSQTAMPTETVAVITLTDTPAPTPDERLIDQSTTYLLCEASDLPAEGRYTMPNLEWKGVTTNADVIDNWNPGLGQEYVEQTGRVEGSWIAFERGVDDVQLPQEFSCDVVRYTTAHGAKRAITDYNSAVAFPDEFSIVDTTVDIGDASVVTIVRERENGLPYIYYKIEFSYRNYLVNVAGWGEESEVSHEVVEAVARRMLAKLQAAPRE